MRFLLILFGVLFAVSGIAYLALNKPGYVLLGYGKTSIEMPLFDFLLILAALLLLLYIVVKLLLGVINTPGGLIRFTHRKQIRKARRDLADGLLQMAQGNWKKAEKLVTAAAEHSESPVINYLVAAHAAQRQKSPERRDDYLRRAIQTDDGTDIAVGLAQAELQMHQRQYEEALATLRRLHALSPRHPFIHKLLARLYHRMGDYESLYELLPKLRKGEKLQADEIRELERATANALLTQAGNDGDLDRLEALWKHLPRSARNEPSLVFIYARALIQMKEFVKARRIIEKTLAASWDDQLAALYGDIEFDDAITALKQAESWLDQHPESPELLVTTARLCIANGLWGKARSLLEQSLALRPSARGYQALAELHEQLDEPESAKRAYKEGFRLLVQRENDGCKPPGPSKKGTAS